MFTTLIVLALLVGVGYVLWRLLMGAGGIEPGTLLGRLVAFLGSHDLAGLQRMAVVGILRLATASIDCRFVPNDIVLLMPPDDCANMRPLEAEFCGGIARLVQAEVKNGPRDKGVPFKLVGDLRIRIKEDARVRRGTVSVRGTFSEKTAVMRPSAPETLTVLDLGDRKIPLQGDLLFGRASHADIVLKSSGVSREHAALSCHGANITVRDLGGPNGTHVNGQPITTARAKVGDQIRFGPEVIGTVRLSARSQEIGHRTTEPLVEEKTD